MTVQHCDELAEAFALGALSAEEADEVARHVQACAACRTTVEAFQAVADRLGLAALPVSPSPRVKQALLERVAAERSTVEPVMPRRRRRLGLAWLAAAAAGVIALVAAGFGWLEHARLAEQQRVVEMLRARTRWQEEMIAVLTSPALVERTLVGTDAAPGATGRLYIDPVSQKACLIADGMPTLSADRAYQLWFIRKDAQRVSGGLFRVDAVGRGWLLTDLPTQLADLQGVGVTAEPAQGSPGPTGPRLLGGQL